VFSGSKSRRTESVVMRSEKKQQSQCIDHVVPHTSKFDDTVAARTIALMMIMIILTILVASKLLLGL
jgi:hypothetical protein